MSVKYYCDSCGDEMPSNEHGRLIVHYKRFSAEVMTAINNGWNSGNLCWKCVKEIVAKGEPNP